MYDKVSNLSAVSVLWRLLTQRQVSPADYGLSKTLYWQGRRQSCLS